MTIPTSDISILHLQQEFGGSDDISLGEYYAGGLYVSNPAPTSIYQTEPIPVVGSGSISLGCFKGVKKFTPVVITPPAQVDMYGHAQGPFNYAATAAYNATNIHYILTASGGVPEQNTLASYTWYWTLKAGSSNYYNPVIADPQANSGSELVIPQNQVNHSIKDFYVTGNQSQYATYIVTVSDGVSSASIEISVSLYW